MKIILILPIALLTLTACAPANVPPEIGYAQSIAAMTATRAQNSAEATQAVIAQSYANEQFNQRLTETALPPAYTATALAASTLQLGLEQAQSRATSDALAYQVSFTATMEALAVLRADSERRIAESQAQLENAIEWGDAKNGIIRWGGLITILGFGVLVAWLILQLCAYILARRRIAETGDKWREIFKQETLMLASGVASTSAGPTSYSVVTVAEKHVANYQSKQHKWRALLKCYVQSCIHLEQGGVKQPFSRPNMLRYELLTDPSTGHAWQLGHDRVIALLRSLKVVDNTGKGGATRLIVEVDSFSRVIDLFPLPELPPDPLPQAKIIVAGWQVAQAHAG